MEKRLSEKMSVMVNPDPNAIPVGALVISGCITRANAGNAATGRKSTEYEQIRGARDLNHNRLGVAEATG